MVYRDMVRAGACAAVTFLVLGSAALRAQTAPEPQRRLVPLREALQLAAKQGPDVAAARARAAIARVGIERAYTAWKADISAAAEGRLYSDAAM